MPNTFEVFKGCNHYLGRKGTEIVYRDSVCKIRPISEEDYKTFRNNILLSLPFITSFDPEDGLGPHCEMETIHITPDNSIMWYNRCLKQNESRDGKKIILLMKEVKEPGDSCDWEWYKVAIHDEFNNKILLRSVFNIKTTCGRQGETGQESLSTNEERWKILGRCKPSKVCSTKVFWETLAYKLNQEAEVEGEIIVIDRY